jgi:hypothetical protein
MSGYLQYSNYGEDETPQLKPVLKSAQPMKPAHKRTLRANPRILRSTQSSANEIQTNQTQAPPTQDIIKRMHNSISGGSDSDSDTDSNEQDTPNVPNMPNMLNMQKQFRAEPGFNHAMYTPANSADLNAKLNPASAKEGFASKTLANSTPKQYPQYMPSVFQASSDPENKDAMLQKLDHIISLLEDQQDEKTGHVTEELILYCFLGVFIIFIVDSFARAGKYVR